MGTLVALYKPFDLSLQNLIKYKYLLYISFLFWFRLCPCTQGKKKGNEKVGREKRKKDQMYQLRYLELLFSKSIGERPTTTCSFPMVIDEHKIKCNCDNKTSNFVQLLL